VDPRRHRRGTRWNLFVTTRANLKYIEVKIPIYGQTPFQPAELQCPGSNGCGPVTTRTGFLRGRDQEIHVSCRVGNRSIRKDRNYLSVFISAFVGIVETVCGLLLIFGLFSRPAALLLLIDISVAILTTKVPLALHKGFWPGGSRGSGGLFDVHEYVVSPHRRCRGPIAGRLVGKKAKRIG